MVTAEIAVALPALLLVLTSALSALSMVSDEVRCVDAARVGARLLARGEGIDGVRLEVSRQAPNGADIVMDVTGEAIRVEVSSDAPRLMRILGVAARPRGVSHAVAEAVP